MSIPLAFVICTEPGRLEPQSLMLAESIRKFCGNLKDTPIYSFHPRTGTPIAIETQKAFEQVRSNPPAITHKPRISRILFSK